MIFARIWNPMRCVGGSCVLTAALIAAAPAHAVNIVIDPDAFPVGTNISGSFSGVTLAAEGGGFESGPSVFAVNPSTHATEPFNASTGTLAFGTSSQAFPHLFREPEFLRLRAQFVVPTDFVSIDFIANDSTDVGRLEAFDTDGNSLGVALSSALNLNQVETVSITRPTRDIAFIWASGEDGGSSIGIDNLQYAPVPEPVTAVMLVMAALAIGIGCRGRFRASRHVVRGADA